MRRVVVTGLGLVTPLACGVEETWSRLIASKSGARKLEGFETLDLVTKIGCQVPRGDGSNGTFNPDQWMDAKEQRRVDEFILFGMAAARQAVTLTILVPYDRGDVVALAHEHAHIVSEEHTNEGTRLVVRAGAQVAGRLEPYAEHRREPENA